MRKISVLVVQRQSHVSASSFSRSVAARITEALDYLTERKDIQWCQKNEEDIEEEELERNDAIIFCKHMSDHAVRIAKKAKNIRILTIYDIDDWLMKFPNYSAANFSQNSLENFKSLMGDCDIVTVANERLLYEMRAYRSELELLPNGFYVEKYSHSKKVRQQKFRIVISNADDIKLEKFRNPFLDILRELHDSNQNIEIDFYGDSFRELKALSFINYKGNLRYDEHKRALAEGGYSLALIPLGGFEDKRSFFFNSCKNPFKYLEYGGLKIPGIYSKTPIYENCVSHHETGILVENKKDC